ncbi:hypothetical protein [Bacteroides gallinarum]|uniref:hypothetical protein n=1 Tax=Bacteroides gallinarum TaxID=376806 RepID=UPI000368C917|nr:hypothetical protein [Bacteroides gallinarum]
MAKIQVLVAMTLDGSIPAETDPLLKWVKDSRHGFPYWYGKRTRMLHSGCPFIDLMCDKDTSAPSDIYLAEVCDEESSEFLRGLSLYHLIDEMVIFLLPAVCAGSGSISGHLPEGRWELVRSKTFKNGVCRLLYRKRLQ